tara:strand:+ start:5172 stop:6059 length:888 start_codon:yes stop_codon:yes gene_type:complete
MAWTLLFLFAFSATSSSHDISDALQSTDPPKHLMLIAGSASHSTGTHEHRAGVLLFERCIAEVEGLQVTTHFEGWPEDESLFETADAAVFYMDGGSNHPVVQEKRLALIQNQIDRGMGYGAIHYAVEVPAENGGSEYKEWIGGYYETAYSVNPIWDVTFDNLPNHPTMRGVDSFTARDEWYFNMRFRQDKVGVTPLVVATPSDETRDGPYVHPQGPYDHIQEAKGDSEIMSWVVDRKDGGRGFGFTGGHFHDNWGIDGFRTIVLNSLVWISGVDVPMEGVQCTVTDEDLDENLDY